MRKPVVLVDMDGPLADFDGRYWEICTSLKIPMDATPETQTHRFASDHVIDAHQRRLSRIIVEQPGWFRGLPVVPGAKDGIERLAEVAEVWICTKPLESSLTCRDEKASWVRNHLGEKWEKRLIFAPDKSLVQGDILLDDAIRMQWLDRASWAPVVFPTVWNGEGSEWEKLPRWDWSMNVADLLQECPDAD